MYTICGNGQGQLRLAVQMARVTCGCNMHIVSQDSRQKLMSTPL